ncbi:MAG: methyltransferase, partial [Bacteroidales bacterium]|nr:methyltransferase [Bacteroidales bacterium]
MSNNFFRFKQFTVFQEHCAMKVGTDGVLLGAWAKVVDCSTVLDVGTGTGLIALMVAQRNRSSVIDAIDIDKGCVMQAEHNVINSPYSHRIDVHRESFQDFAQQIDTKYDLIISNPPYFKNSLKSPNLARSNA